MMNALRAIAILTVISCFTVACVSVKLDGGESKRASGVKFETPGGDFQKAARDDVDMAWRNPKNGNVISYLSDCQDVTDPSLDSIVQGVMSSLYNMNIDSNESPTIQGREARRVLASGKVDGVPSKIDLLVFKRNQCIYILTYVGVAKEFGANRGEFDKFVQGFRAP